MRAAHHNAIHDDETPLQRSTHRFTKHHQRGGLMPIITLPPDIHPPETTPDAEREHAELEAALATLRGLGIGFEEVPRCPHPGCEVCEGETLRFAA